MSISLVLVPLAIAAVTALHTARGSAVDREGRMVCQVGTRMRDTGLLADALGDVAADVTVQGPNAVTATWDDVSAHFTRDPEGTWGAHLTGTVDEGRARDVVAAIDAAYGRRVQAAVLRRLRERAPAAGLRFDSETIDQDDTVTVVLTVQQGA